MSEKNKLLMKQYIQKNGRFELKMYHATLLSLDLREQGVSSVISNAVAYGRYLLGETGAVEEESYQQLVKFSRQIWEMRGKPHESSEFRGNLSCPICGKKVLLSPLVVKCENNRARDERSCRFYFFRNFCDYTFTEQDIQQLLSGQTTKLIRGLKRKDKTTFSARLVLLAFAKNQTKLGEASRWENQENPF